MASKCTAINLSDELQCEEEAKSLNGLFCHFHSKQCQGQWGTTPTPASRANNFEQAFVKVINLVTPSSTPLQNIPQPRSSLANQTSADVKSQATLHELHAYLTLKYRLLDQVLRARSIHHSRFFSLNLDYGYQLRNEELLKSSLTICLL